MKPVRALIGLTALLAGTAPADVDAQAAVAAMPPVCAGTTANGGRAADGSSMLDASARALSVWLAESRDAAVREGVRPIPDGIRTQLEGFVPTATLDTVRWRVGGQSPVALHTHIAGLGVVAITFDAVIVFADRDTALTNAGLWAHELRHVMQYEHCGIDGFARSYLHDRDALERDAHAYALAWHQWTLDRWLEQVSADGQ